MLTETLDARTVREWGDRYSNWGRSARLLPRPPALGAFGRGGSEVGHEADFHVR